MTTISPRQALQRAASPQRRADAGGRPFDLTSLTLSTAKLRVDDIEADVVDATIEQTITGSSSLSMTLADPEWRWTTSPFFSSRSMLTVDGLPYVLAAVSRQSGQRLQATFEPWPVAALRVPDAPRKARRTVQMSRARFAAEIIGEIPGVPAVVPELRLRQPVAKPDQSGRALPYEFRRGEGGVRESSWVALQRLAEEVGWRCYEVAGAVWFVSDDYLMAQPPLLSAVRASADWIDDLAFDHDTGMRVSSATLTCLAERWAIPPGSRVMLTGFGAGSGPWLVETTRRSLWTPHVEVGLTRRRPRLPEPAPDTEQVAEKSGMEYVGGSAGGGAATGDAPASIAALIVRAAQETGVPAALLAAICKQESGYNQQARSAAGAMGLMQLMPDTARGLGVDPADPWQNMLGGARYIGQQLSAFGGDVRLALAAYNAGPGAVKRYGGVPPYAETQKYVQVVYGNFQKFQAAAAVPSTVAAVADAQGWVFPYPGMVKMGGGPTAHHARALGDWQSDDAWDLMGNAGDPVVAAHAGTISRINTEFISEPGRRGRSLYLDVPGGQLWYKHLDRIVVTVGQRVHAGQVLAYIAAGTNGGPHLHLGANPVSLGQRAVSTPRR